MEPVSNDIPDAQPRFHLGEPAADPDNVGQLDDLGIGPADPQDQVTCPAPTSQRNRS